MPEAFNLLPAGEAAALITKAGIPAAAAPLARDADEAVALAGQFGYPVVRIASPDIAHKSEVGGVLVGLENDDEVRQGFEEMMEASKLFDGWPTFTASPSPPWPSPAAWKSSWEPSPTRSTAPP